MIIDAVKGDVFEAPHKHIAFAINSEGANDAGFAGAVASRYWPTLADTGPIQLGESFSNEVGGKVFHGLVCHSLGASGWSGSPDLVTKALDGLSVPDDEPIAVVWMGTGPVGRMTGADPYALLGGMDRSTKSVVVYTRG